MLLLILSLDYELYGNGSGDVGALIYRPTNDILDACDTFGARLTIFAEVCELMAMKGVPEFNEQARMLEGQLTNTVQRGHDVQLHLHPQWVNGKWSGDSWQLDYSRVAISKMPLHEILSVITEGKRYLEALLRPVDGSYECCGFRAGYWCLMPSENILRALEKVGIRSDSSVFKWGVERNANFSYDYREAYSNLAPWIADYVNVNRKSQSGYGVVEIPIYSDRVFFPQLLTRRRLEAIKASRKSRRDVVLNEGNEGSIVERFGLLLRKRARKFDFCRCNERELRTMLNKAIRESKGIGETPICAIGHSKDFSSARDFKAFLSYVKRDLAGEVEFVTYRDALLRWESLAVIEAGARSFREG